MPNSRTPDGNKVETVEPQEVAKAAQIFERLKVRVSAEHAALEAAEKTLKAWFASHPEANDYDGRIRCTRSTRRQLDIGAVRQHLGVAAEDFMRQAPTLGLKLVHPALREHTPGAATELLEATCKRCGATLVASVDLRPVLDALGWQHDGEGHRCARC